MDLNLFFALLGGLLVLAFLANRLVRFTHVPDVLILMATGVLIGPVLHWVNPEVFRGATHGFGSLALILILFEGGLDLKLREILRHFAGGSFLSIFSYVVSVAGVAALCRYLLYYSWIPALLIGAVLGCISSSIVLPVLQQMRLRREVKITLLVEASFGDALAVLAVTTLLDIAAGGSASAKDITWNLGGSLILAVATAMLAGIFWSYLLPVLSDQRFWHVLTFGAVLLVYAGVEALKGNSLVGVLAFGITLANYPSVRRRLQAGEEAPSHDWFAEVPIQKRGAGDDHPHGQMLTFHGELAFLIRTFFFVLIGALVNFAGLYRNLFLAAACLVAILLARVLVVQVGRFAWKSFTALEREIMVWLMPRGLITAVLGIQVLEGRGREFAFLPDLAFAVILGTNLMLLMAGIRARRLPELQVEETAAVAVHS